MKYNIDKNMKFKEKIKFYSAKKKFEDVNNELSKKKKKLEEINNAISLKNEELEEINSTISLKNEELASLKREIIKLKDFINGKFCSEFNKNYDYKVDIRDCYIISLNGKKYITKRMYRDSREYYTNFRHYAETFVYFDIFNIKKEDKKVHYCRICLYTLGSYGTCFGNKPEYEEHILNLYPELKMYTDGYVPNTHLKKIYYEINGLGNLVSSEEQNFCKTKQYQK